MTACVNIGCSCTALNFPHHLTGESLSWSTFPWQPAPPFVTPHGSSCLHFYHFGGATSDMTLGFEFNDAFTELENLEALTEHVRKV